MSGAGRGVTPGAEPEAGRDESAAPGEPEQARASSADNAAETPDAKVPDQAQAETSSTAQASRKAETGSNAEASGSAADGDSAADAAPDGKTASGGRKPAARRGRRKRSFWREFPILVVVALLLAVIIKTYAIQAFFIPSGSMENTLEINDRVLVNKLVYDVRSIHRGDIVVFNGDGSWDPGTAPRDTNFVVKFAQGFASMFGFGHPGDILIKRVIGLPGDKVACCDAQGRVTVNGVPLTEQTYLYPGDAPSEIRFNVVVPAGRLWVMGDHRLISDDSRDHLGQPGGGTVPENVVIGRAFVIIWPISRWRFLPVPATFEQPKLSAAAPPAAQGTVGPAATRDTANLLSARLEPSSPALPLALGFAAAVPVTWLQRRARFRLARRRTACGPGGRTARRAAPRSARDPSDRPPSA
ncbi:MAG TPA: signal peptidase I [Streptosporangiaceae bacterium]